MATFSVASMGASLPTVYRRKLTLTQRKTPTLRLFSQLGMLNQGTTGPAMTWQVKTSGQVAGNVDLDGGNFLTAASDAPQNVSIAFGTYEAPAKVTDDLLWKSQTAAGVPADYSTMTNVMAEQMVDAVSANLKLVEQQIYNGSGATNQMTGLSTAVATGAYGGLTNGEWVSRVTVNGGVLRNLTLALLKTELRNISILFNGGRPNLGLCPPGMMDALEALFDPYLQMPSPPSATAGVSNSGKLDRAVMNPGTIHTIGGDINMDGFRHLYWATGGVHFIEAPDCLNSAATNTTAGIYFLSSDMVGVDYLPPPGPTAGAPDAKAVTAIEQELGAIGQIPFEMISRGRVEHSRQWDITGKLGLKLLDRRCASWLGDLQ